MDIACFQVIVLLIAFVPMSTRLASLLTRRILNLFDLTSSCNHKCATSMWLIFSNSMSVWYVFRVQLRWILVIHIVNFSGLHCVPILEPQNESFTLKNQSVEGHVGTISLYQHILRLNALMLFAEPAPMMLALIGYTLSSCFLSSNRLSFDPATVKSSP